jgi:hypothetical protein
MHFNSFVEVGRALLETQDRRPHGEACGLLILCGLVAIEVGPVPHPAIYTSFLTTELPAGKGAHLVQHELDNLSINVDVDCAPPCQQP